MRREITAGFGAALAAGIVVGAASRVLMRLVALAGEGPVEFSWAGTLGICMVFAAAMLPGAVLAAMSRRRFRWLVLAAAAALLFVPATGIASAEVDNTAAFGIGQWAGVLSAGAGVFVLIAALPVVTLRLVDRLSRGHPRREPPGASIPATPARDRRRRR